MKVLSLIALILLLLLPVVFADDPPQEKCNWCWYPDDINLSGYEGETIALTWTVAVNPAPCGTPQFTWDVWVDGWLIWDDWGPTTQYQYLQFITDSDFTIISVEGTGVCGKCGSIVKNGFQIYGP